MHDTPDTKTQVEANGEMLRAQAPFVALLNGLTDAELQWQTAFGRQDYVDVFGDLIPKGRSHYRQGMPSDDSCLRLSARSMDGVLTVMLSNRHAVNLAKKIKTERFEQLRIAMKALS